MNSAEYADYQAWLAELKAKNHPRSEQMHEHFLNAFAGEFAPRVVVKITAEQVLAAYRKATGEAPVEPPQGGDAAAAGARAIIEAYNKCLKGE